MCHQDGDGDKMRQGRQHYKDVPGLVKTKDPWPEVHDLCDVNNRTWGSWGGDAGSGGEGGCWWGGERDGRGGRTVGWSVGISGPLDQ